MLFYCKNYENGCDGRVRHLGELCDRCKREARLLQENIDAEDYAKMHIDKDEGIRHHRHLGGSDEP